MVHKKHQSKRISSSRNAKNHKNAAEKKRKLRKAAKLNPQGKRIKKDPGIPNLWPFKEKILQEIEMARNQGIEVMEENVPSGPSDIEITHNPSLGRLAREAAKRQAAYEEELAEKREMMENVGTSDPALIGNKDNSRKAYFKEFKKVLDGADVLLEVLDARDPLGCRTRNIERMILNDPKKRVVLVLNKIDLVPPEVADAWIKYLRKELPTIGFKSSTQTQRTNISQNKTHVKNADSDLLAKSSTVGADSLIKLLKNYSRSQNLKTSLTVGVIGYPNVGKSSLINSLKRTKVCGVGSRPGFTKVAQEIHLDAKLKLLDCPGIVFGGATSKKMNYGDVLLRNCIKVELLDDPIAAVDYLLKKTKLHYVMMQYNIPMVSDVKGFLVELARKRMFLKKNGIPDLEGTARLVLRDWNCGNISYYTLPPKDKVNSVISSEVLTTWGKEFELESYDQEVIPASKSGSFSRAMVMEESMEGPDYHEAEFINMVNDEAMEDESPEVIVSVRNPKNTASGAPVVEKKKAVSFEDGGAQLNKDLKRKQKKDKKVSQKAQKDSLELMDMITEGDNVEDEYDFGVLDHANLPEMDD